MEGDQMAIVFNRLHEMMRAKGWTNSRVRKEGLVGQATYAKLMKNEGYVDTRTIDNLCRVLGCQPGDIMEYVEDGSSAQE
ncbi:MAG: helix-turn-helix transcriptional regulator [Clostridiales bacterium]|nr:helix-turn-helix transcriptional regulator [Clostridiales bacterium]